MDDPAGVRGRITDLHRAALHDGPGVRTTVFLQGCPLRCAWCHNPETWTPATQIGFSPEKCGGCGGCAAVCPQDCHSVDADGHAFDRAECVGCGSCAAACGTHALLAWGRETTAGEVVATAARDRAYYQRGGGGLTVSGGEPLAQPLFTTALLTLARAQGIHTCLDTSGYAPAERFQAVAALADLLLFDLKAGRERHRELTGVALDPILANLDWALEHGIPVRLRCPLVPGVNDEDEHLARIRDYARRPGVVGCDLLPYHRYGADKWARLGLAYSLAGRPDAGPEDERRWRAALAG
jgi:pyruvate formate lyase activating enzyme